MSEFELVPADPESENPFHSDPGKPGFESLGNNNGFRFWRASALAGLLGYSSYDTFRKCIQKAIGVCVSLGIDINQNIVQDGKDFKLSRFSCYLVAMNSDSKKREVALAQAYFSAMASAVADYMAQADGVERVHIRGKLSEHEKSLSHVARLAGVENYAFFQNAGYRGLYNMDLGQLRLRKGIPSGRSPLDFMNQQELAANLFRITQTEAKIQNDQIQGQKNLENTAHAVGKEVRSAISRIGAPMPETLPKASDIKEVKKTIKGAHREMKRIDGKTGKSPKTS